MENTKVLIETTNWTGEEYEIARQAVMKAREEKEKNEIKNKFEDMVKGRSFDSIREILESLCYKYDGNVDWY